MNSEEVMVSASRIIEIICYLRKVLFANYKTIAIPHFLLKSYKTTRTKNAGMAKCHACIFLLKVRLEQLNATWISAVADDSPLGLNKVD